MVSTSGEVKDDLIERAVALAAETFSHDDHGDAEAIAGFVRLYYRRVAAEDLAGRGVVDVAGAAMAHWRLAASRPPGTPRVRVYNPEFDQHGWQSRHTVVDIVTDDMPFLVDSTRMELGRHGLGIHVIFHPLVQAVRTAGGALVPGPVDDAGAEVTESFIHLEVERQTEPVFLDDLERDVRRVLQEVRAANEDWLPMKAQMLAAAASLASVPADVEDDPAETRALLEWLADEHFTFLGYREYELVRKDGVDGLRTLADTGLGLLRGGGTDDGASRSFSKLPPEVRRKARERRVLNLTKANAVSTVHRPSYLDYVGIKQFDAAGSVVGERRFLGLFTSAVYNARALDIPLVGPKVHAVLERSGYPEGGHDRKELLQILETYPRDELFQISEDELYDVAIGILQLQERRLVRLFARRDAFGRFVSCLVFLPRDRYTTESRLAIQAVLLDAFRGRNIDYTTRVSESVLARLHFVIHTEAGDHTDPDLAAVEARLVEVTRSWTDELLVALSEQFGEEQAVRLHRRYGGAFPAGYREAFLPRSAVADIRRLEDLNGGSEIYVEGDPDGLGLALYTRLVGREGELRLKLFRSGHALSLSDVLPHLRGLGVTVVDERPFEITADELGPRWIYDFGLRCAPGVSVETDRARDAFVETFDRVWRGEVESDGFNRLVLGAGLGWRDIAMLRAYSRYLRQTGSTFSPSYLEDTLVAHPYVARLLVELFRIRFAPPGVGGSGPSTPVSVDGGERRAAGREFTPETRHLAQGRTVDAIETALESVASLDDDRILRSFLSLIESTLRTNFFQRGPWGPKPAVSFKLDPALVPDLPLPRPAVELFVYSPRVEGVHLRAGRVARGGIRWSDRREDFRTEVLGLMKAQAVKNAVIVPVGAKGGFVVKQPPPGGDRAQVMAEVVDCYRTFITGLLELTDNIVDGTVVPPADVVRYDGDDAYLVVAADKGTATFSDIANGIATSMGFWLGDAFASGGSAGYDHKAMGITARGAWESVKRHFRNLSVDIATTDFTVVGIGDMSGDVFGNGMLLSPHIALVAAFDHRHIFLDPDPDPEASFAVRRELFARPGSSWADYDPQHISAGGGVFVRSAKSIALTDPVRRVLGTDAESLTPAEVVRAILRAPVDLLWNGGIGTYVKAVDESHTEVGDKSNDAVRIDAAELRCRVVGEGGNLGFTQRGRIEAARGGVRINTDAIDNSAGVDCSDHEVNIKILLDTVVAAGDLTGKQRNTILAEMTDEVAALVLRDNADQAQALDNALAQSRSMADVHARYLRALEQAGRLDRAVEFLPDDEEMTDRRTAGEGLCAPEFAVLLAYTKNLLQAELLDSDLPEDPFLHRELVRYFPTPLRTRFAREMEGHRLRREIIATVVANRTVNLAGTTFAYRLREETSVPMADIVRAHYAAHEVFALSGLLSEIVVLGQPVTAARQTAMLLEARKLTERATRWFLHHRRGRLDVAATIDWFAEGVATVTDRLPELVVGPARDALERTTARLVDDGVPLRLASRVAGLGELFSALDVVEVGRATHDSVETVARTYFALGDELGLEWVRNRIVDLPRDNRWQALARASLRDDLYRMHAGLAADVLAHPGAGSGRGPDDRLEAWVVANQDPVNRYRRMLNDVMTGAPVTAPSGGSGGPTGPDLAVLSVLVREIRSLICTDVAAVQAAGIPAG